MEASIVELYFHLKLSKMRPSVLLNNFKFKIIVKANLQFETKYKEYRH
jgi:hypothetical protein